MKIGNIGGYKSINAYVAAKLEKLAAGRRDFGTLFEMMFSEGGNVMYERSTGYRIEKTTYAQAKDRALRLAAAIADALSGAEKGAVVGLHMENGVEWIELFWAILAAGFRPLLMNLRLDAQTLEQALADTSACAVITDGRTFSVKSIAAESVEAAEAPIEIGEFGSEIMVMSSGTTANVKICAYTARELINQIADAAAVIRESERMKEHYEGELKQLTFLPFYHIFGLIAVYLWFAFFSRTFVHLPDLSPATIQNTIRRHKVTHIFAVPLFWNKTYEQAMKVIRARGEKTAAKFEKGMAISRRLAGFPRIQAAFAKRAFREVRDGMFGDSVKFMITGGSEISPQVLEFFNAIGYHIADGYGMTEIGVTSVELSDDVRTLNACSVGHPLPSAEYRINESGELLVRSNASAAYIIEGGRAAPRDEWFNTHDLAERQGGGFRILGRRDDVVVSPTGENLNPNIIEPRFSDIDGVNEAALVGVKSGAAVDPVLIASVDKYISDAAVAELRDMLRERAAEIGVATQIKSIFVTSDPLIAGDEFKLNRRLIALRYAAGRYAPAGAARASGDLPDDAVSLKVRDIFAGALGIPAENVGADFDFFADGGGSSLDYFGMLTVMGEEFGTSIPADGDAGLSTVRGIADFVKAKLQ